MQINSVNNKTAIGKKGKTTKKTEIGNFSAFIATSEDSSEVESPHTSSQINQVNPFLFLQEYGNESSELEKFYQHSDNILSHLENIRDGILNAEFDMNELKNLSQLIQNLKNEFNHPDLQEIFAEIELRAAVEVAKYEKFARNES